VKESIKRATAPVHQKGTGETLTQICFLKLKPIRMITVEARTQTYHKPATVGAFHQALRGIDGSLHGRGPAYLQIWKRSVITDRGVAHVTLSD
jgi:hypothetical protein